MIKLETNDWMLLNNIIYKIHTTQNFDDMRRELLEQLRMLLDFDSADFYMASEEEGKLLCNSVTYNCDEDLSEMYEDIDYSRAIMTSGKMLVYRETDIISDEARVKSDYYNKMANPTIKMRIIRKIIVKLFKQWRG